MRKAVPPLLFTMHIFDFQRGRQPPREPPIPCDDCGCQHMDPAPSTNLMKLCFKSSSEESGVPNLLLNPPPVKTGVEDLPLPERSSHLPLELPRLPPRSSHPSFGSSPVWSSVSQPLMHVSVVDLTCSLEKATTYEEICTHVKALSEGCEINK